MGGLRDGVLRVGEGQKLSPRPDRPPCISAWVPDRPQARQPSLRGSLHGRIIIPWGMVPNGELGNQSWGTGKWTRPQEIGIGNHSWGM